MHSATTLVFALLLLVAVATATTYDVTEGSRRAVFDDTAPFTLKMGRENDNTNYVQLQYTSMQGVTKDSSGTVTATGNTLDIANNLVSGSVSTSTTATHHSAIVQTVTTVGSSQTAVQLAYYMGRTNFTYNGVTIENTKRCVTEGTAAPTCGASRSVKPGQLKFAIYSRNFPFQAASTHLRITATLRAFGMPNTKIYFNGDPSKTTVASMAGIQLHNITFENDAVINVWSWEQKFNRNGATVFGDAVLTLSAPPTSGRSAQLNLDFPRAGWDGSNQWMLYDPETTVTFKDVKTTSDAASRAIHVALLLLCSLAATLSLL